METTTFVGMDVHKKAINVAMLVPKSKEPVQWSIANEPRAIKRMVKKIVKQAEGEIRCCYEAGPCGYALQRTMESVAPVVCAVVAPSLIPVKPGERIKTDKRDALKLAQLHRADLLTEIAPPTPEEEAARDLCRAREAAMEDLKRAKHRMVKFVLKRGYIYTARAWTKDHRRWLRAIEWENEIDRMIFEDALWNVLQHEERLVAMDRKLHDLALQEPHATPVGWLRCFRGIDTVTAMTIVAELYGFCRFGSARALMAYLGMAPGEHSSGDTIQHRGITKAGNRRVRRLLIEAAWHYRHKPSVSAALRKRREGQPTEVIAIAERAQKRLYSRYWHLAMGKNKPKNKAVVAVARELVGFIWAVLYPMTAGVAHA